MEETKVGQLVIDLRIKTEALEKGLESAKKKLQEIESQNKQVENSNSSLDASFIAMSAGIAASLAKIKSAIDDGVNKYNTYINSMQALQKTAKATNTSMTQIKNAMKDVNEFKLMDESDLNSSIKNLLTYGFTIEQASNMLKVLQDAAVGNRQENYSLSEAVRVTTEGIRMENSVLSDAAGVQKNISKMYEEHAKSMGKTTDSLTQAEKAQAVYNGIMNEASMFIGSAKEMAEGYQGVQAQANASSLELSKTLGESMLPVLTQYNSLQLSITKGLTEFVSNHKGATSGIVVFTTTLLAATVAMIALKTANEKFAISSTVATIATKGFTAALKANPIFIIATTIATVITGISMLCSAIKENEEAQAKLNETTERYKKIKDGAYEFTDENISTVEKDNEQIKEQIKILEKKIELEKELDKLKVEGISGTYSYKTEDLKKVNQYLKQIEKTEKQFKDTQESTENYGNSIEELNNKLNDNKKYLSEADAVKKISTGLDTETVEKQQQEAAQLKVNVQTMQEYLDVVKKGNTSTTQYQEAVKQLAKAYPEAANAEGIIIDKAQDCINAEALKADSAWKSSQDTINSYIEVIKAALNSESVQKQVAQNIGISIDDLNMKLQSTLTLYNAMANIAPAAVAGVTPVSVSAPKLRSSGGSKSKKSYENKALDNYKKQIEHKKSLDQISLQQEISMYQIALKKYAKTQDEKWELTEKIYSLQKELSEKSLNDYTSNIEHKKSLDQINLKQEIEMYQIALKRYAKTQEERKELTEKIYELQKELQEESLNNYMTNIEHKKSLDKLSLEDEINMYQYAYNNLAKTTEQKRELEEKLYDLRKELAKKNKELLDQKITDYKRHIEDQKNIRGAEYDAKEQEKDLNKIISLHKYYLNQIIKDERLSLEERKDIYQEELQTIRDYEQQKRDIRVQSVDNTVSQLTNAITKQLEEMQETDKKAIEENIELVEKWKETRIKAINEEYEARIEAIQKELDLLDKSEEDKTRAEEDAEYQRKKNRLEQLIVYEHDATTKANYQKELDKLVADYQKTLDKRALQDKKDALKEQQDLLKEEQDNKVQVIEDEADRQKEQYNKQLDELEKYYNKQKELAQKIAEKMLLNVEKNQKQILNLLKTYGNAYEITGQSLGEKLAQGINKGVANKIQNIIQKIQDTIDAGIENKIKEWTSGIYQYETGKNKPQTTKTVTVTQINHIEQNPEMPSEAQRKLKNISEKLATEIAGM